MSFNLDKVPNKMTKVGRLTQSELKSLRVAFTKLDLPTETDVGFIASYLTETDHIFAKRHGFYRAMKQALKRNDYAMFLSVRVGESALKAVFKRVTDERNRVRDSIAFSGYYAMQHNDQHISTDGQLCFIVQNPDEHVLWSKHRDQSAVELTPKTGDIVYLNTHQEHALMIGKGMQPLQFYAVTFYTKP